MQACVRCTRKPVASCAASIISISSTFHVRRTKKQMPWPTRQWMGNAADSICCPDGKSCTNLPDQLMLVENEGCHSWRCKRTGLPLRIIAKIVQGAKGGGATRPAAPWMRLGSTPVDFVGASLQTLQDKVLAERPGSTPGVCFVVV